MMIYKIRFIVSLIGISFLYADNGIVAEKEIILVDRTFERRGCSECGYATLENARGFNGEKAYDNQDRGCLITAKSPVAHSFENLKISLGDLLAGKIPTLSFSPGIFVIGVFDGHGKNGDAISALTRFMVSDYFKTFFAIHETKILYHDFFVLGKSIQSMLSHNLLAKESGTTGCFCMLEGPLEGTGKVFTTIKDVDNGEQKEELEDAAVKLYRAVFTNVGDSRAIVIRHQEVIFSTVDHKPTTPTEKDRIEQAGGFVQNGYAYGSNGYGFALSRSWGDCVAHNNGVLLSIPEVHSFGVPTQPSNSLLKIKENSTYLLEGDIIVCATDGLWDVFTNQEVAHYINRRKQEGASLQVISEELTQKARNGVNIAFTTSVDDITVIIVQL